VLTTESGTALTVLNNLGVGYGNHTATALHTVTVAALDGTGDHTEARHFIHGVKGIDADAFADLSLTVNWLKDGAPIVLYKGSALLIYAYTGDGAGTARPVFQWAELDAATYLP